MQTTELGNPSLSIILPALNASRTIAHQLEALVGQTFQGSWELIVADNGSRDHTPAIVNEYLPRLRHARLISAARRRGAGAARNEAVKVANGDCFVFCDADDVVWPGWLAGHAEALRISDFVGGYHAPFTGYVPPVEAASTAETRQSSTQYAGVRAPWGCNVSVRRDAFNRVGGFNEALRRGQDVELAWRLFKVGIRPTFSQDATIWKRLPNPGAAITLLRHWKIAYYEPLRYRIHPDMVRRDEWAHILKAYTYLITHLPLIFDDETRVSIARLAGRRFGRVAGSLRYRTLFL